MTTKTTPFVSGVIIILLVVGVYFYAIYSFNPSPAEVNATAQPIAPIDTNLINSVTTQINTRQINGTLPISVSNQNTTNPFNSVE